MQIIQFSPEYDFGHAQELIVADGSALEIVTLLQGAAAPTLLLADACHALQAITTALVGEDLHTLHLVAHGQAGGFSMGGQWIDAAALRDNAHLLVQWNVQRIALWSCEQGQSIALLDNLARLTGAQVFASPKALGFHTETQTRHWELLCADHPAAAPVAVPFQASVVQSWDYQLVTLKITGLYKATVSGAANTYFGEETNSVTISTTPFATNNVTFSQSGIQFSGNNVSGTVSYIDSNNNTQTFSGLASRPIKVGGVIKGFYVWLDKDTSGSGSVGDEAFVLSVDNSYFNNNANIGSSSDRVDSALNSLLPASTPLAAVADVSNLALTAGAAAIGNVLTNDTGSTNSGETKTVAKVGTSSASTAVTGSTTSANGPTVTGAYGTLTIGADGSYSYVVNNSNAAVQKLRLSTDTLSDTFTYQVADAIGATSATTLTVKIQGSNDAPTASIDYNTAKESITTPSSVAGYSATGSVLSNDTDVDGYSETKALATGSATVASFTSATPSSALTFTGASGFTSVGSGDELYIQINSQYVAVFADAAGTTRISVGTKTLVSGSSYNITLSATPAYYYAVGGNVAIPNLAFLSGKSAGFKESTNNIETDGGQLKTAIVSGTAPSGGSTITLNGATGTVAVGMKVSGTGIPADAVVTTVSGTQITVDQAITITNGGALNFTYVGTHQGTHGTLTLSADGSYTYTPTSNNSSLQEGQSALETFNYAMQDAAGATSSSQLKITVYGTGTNDPVVVPDTSNLNTTAGASGGPALEGVGSSHTGGANAIGNVLTNDTPVNVGTNTVVDIQLPSAGSATAVTSGTTSANGTSITGQYGTLTIGTDGSYSYVPDNTNATVNALNSGQTLSESFTYTVQNGLNQTVATSTKAQASTTLTVVIKGTNDAPTLTADTASAVEAGGVNNALAACRAHPFKNPISFEFA